MKPLLSVITTLLQINGVIALLVVVFMLSMREQKPEIIAKVPHENNKSESFRRELHEPQSDYQQHIQDQDHKLQVYNQEIQRLKAELDTYKTIKDFVNGINGSSTPNLSSSQGNIRETTGTVRQAMEMIPSSQDLRNITQTSISLKLNKNSLQEGQLNRYQDMEPRSPLSHVTDHQYSATPRPSKDVNQNNPQEIPESSLSRSSSQSKQPERTTPHIAMTIVPRAETEKVAQEEIKNPPQWSENSVNDTNELNNQPLLSRLVPLKTQETIPDETPRDRAIHLANDLTVGLLVAGIKGKIHYGTRTYYQVQTAIRSLRKGSSYDLVEASRRSQLSTSILEQVAKWGANRPGSLSDSNQIGFAEVE